MRPMDYATTGYVEKMERLYSLAVDTGFEAGEVFGTLDQPHLMDAARASIGCWRMEWQGMLLCVGVAGLVDWRMGCVGLGRV